MDYHRLRCDLIAIFNDEYSKKNLLTADNTAKCLFEKGYVNIEVLLEKLTLEICEIIDNATDEAEKSIRDKVKLTQYHDVLIDAGKMFVGHVGVAVLDCLKKYIKKE